MQGYHLKFKEEIKNFPDKKKLRNKELPRQEKAKGVYHYQARVTNNVKGNSLRGEKRNINMKIKLAIHMHLPIITFLSYTTHKNKFKVD